MGAVKDTKIRMLQQSACLWQLCCPACAHNGLHEQAKIEDRGYNVVAFCAGARLDRGAKERTYGTQGRSDASGMTKEPLLWVRRRRGREKLAQTKKVPEP